MTALYGRAKIVTLRRDVNALRRAIRTEGTTSVQDAWDKVERWVDRIFTIEQHDVPSKSENKDT